VRQTKERQTIIEKAREHLGRSSTEVEEDLFEGPAAEAILSVAAVRKPDLIVMGSLQGAVFGSVSTKVSHDASCPVMVAR
jgi:nucleotide-binding universal stress UspA family protein